MGDKGKASSSKGKTTARAEPKYKTYNARAALNLYEHKQAYTRLTAPGRRFWSTKFFHFDTLEELGITSIVMQMLEKGGFRPLATSPFPTSPLLTLEFLASLCWDPAPDNVEGLEPMIAFRLKKTNYSLTLPRLR